MGRAREDVRYTPIRSLLRGMEVLQTINHEGSITLTKLCALTGLPYATCFRLVQTLIVSGYVECEPTRKWYRSTILTRSLSSGFPEDSRLVTVARPHLVQLTEKLAWPVALTTRVGNTMMVQDSTHSLTSLTLSKYAPGFSMPLAECSSGKVYLAFCSEEERQSIRTGLGLLEDPADRIGVMLMDGEFLFDEIRRLGYATQVRNAYTSNPGKTSSIAVPINHGNQLLGALSIAFFTVGLKLEKAVDAFVEDLKAAAAQIGMEMAA